MIQDIDNQIFYNQYQNQSVQPEDRIFHFDNRTVLVKTNEQKEIVLPTYEELCSDDSILKKSVKSEWQKESIIYLFAIDEQRYFLLKSRERCQLSGYDYESIQIFRSLMTKATCFAGMTAFHLATWYQNNQYCGRCGARLVPGTKERVLTCACGNMVYPFIAPAVIVGVTDGDRIVITRYAGREYKKEALIAGFTEIGESFEDTVKREVMEEVGLRVKNIRYYKSQPWGMASNLLAGFWAELEGSDKITREEEELAVAEWVKRDEIDYEDNGVSLTGEMINAFKNGAF